MKVFLVLWQVLKTIPERFKFNLEGQLQLL